MRYERNDHVIYKSRWTQKTRKNPGRHLLCDFRQSCVQPSEGRWSGAILCERGKLKRNSIRISKRGLGVSSRSAQLSCEWLVMLVRFTIVGVYGQCHVKFRRSVRRRPSSCVQSCVVISKQFDRAHTCWTLDKSCINCLHFQFLDYWVSGFSKDSVVVSA
jgi:hypothetical protein